MIPFTSYTFLTFSSSAAYCLEFATETVNYDFSLLVTETVT